MPKKERKNELVKVVYYTPDGMRLECSGGNLFAGVKQLFFSMPEGQRLDGLDRLHLRHIEREVRKGDVAVVESPIEAELLALPAEERGQLAWRLLRLHHQAVLKERETPI